MLQLSPLMWGPNMSLDGQQRPIKVTEETDSRAFCIPWSLMWGTCSGSHRTVPSDQGQHWLLWAVPAQCGAPRPTSGWLPQRSPSQQAGVGDVLEKLLRVGAEQKTHLCWGVNAVLLWSPETMKSCIAHNLHSFPNSAQAPHNLPLKKSVSCVHLLTLMKKMLL